MRLGGGPDAVLPRTDVADDPALVQERFFTEEPRVPVPDRGLGTEGLVGTARDDLAEQPAAEFLAVEDTRVRRDTKGTMVVSLVARQAGAGECAEVVAAEVEDIVGIERAADEQVSVVLETPL
jgi:hypothetical protein